MLKQKSTRHHRRGLLQPPPGGCVLKRGARIEGLTIEAAATSGWLCVETERLKHIDEINELQPPSGGCVLKQEV